LIGRLSGLGFLILTVTLCGSCTSTTETLPKNTKTQETTSPSTINNSQSSQKTPQAQPTSQTENLEIPALSQTCTNEQIGYTVQYPQKWVTNSPKIAGKCHYFGKQPFQVEPYKKNVFISIQMENDSLQKYRTTKNRDNNKNNLGSKKLYRNTTTISDRQTIVTEVEGTGKVMLRQGIKMYIYQVDMGDRTLVARTYEIPSQNYHRNKKIMDAMMDSLEIKAPSPK
jgi:hypothetical protein